VGLTFGPTGLTEFAWVHKRPESFGVGTEIDDQVTRFRLIL